MLRSFYLSLIFLVFFGAAIPANAGLIIDPTFDSSITTQADASAIEGAIEAAIDVFETTYSNPITVDIYFQAGGGLGESQFYWYTANYQTFYNQLVSTDANPAAIAGLAANGGNSANNPITGTSEIDIKSADARALGFDAPPGCIPTGSAGNKNCTQGTGADAVDGIISLNTSITFPPQSESGSTYDLTSVAEHEIDEILGLGSSLPNTSAGSGTVDFTAGNPAPEDLFRYTAPGDFAKAVNCASPVQAYFSYSGSTNLNNFNTACNGDDFGDWLGGGSPQVQDAVGTPDATIAYGQGEIDAMSAIGYTLADPAPEPATWILLLVSLGLLACAKKRLPAQTR